MRRKGTSEQLAIIRNRGLALLEKGKKAERGSRNPQCHNALCVSMATREPEAEAKKGNSPARTPPKDHREASQKT